MKLKELKEFLAKFPEETEINWEDAFYGGKSPWYELSIEDFKVVNTEILIRFPEDN